MILSISVLLSDRLDTIRRCLDSLTPLRQAVSSELILVVTTTDPRVHKLAGEYADRIVEFEWCNDFSKARNAGLAVARGEWFLYLDDDEWFEDCGEFIRFFQSGEYQNYAFANYIQRNFQDSDLQYYADTPVTRMVRREEKIRFRSRIHEYFYPVEGSYKNIPAVALHTGYIGAGGQVQKQRFRRNAPLLMEMMEEEPDNLRWQIQLLQEYREVELWAWEYTLGRECLEKLGSVRDEEAYAAFCGAVVEGLTEMQRREEVRAFIQSGLADTRSSKLTKAFLYLEAALNDLRDRQTDAAQEDLDHYFRLCRELEQNPDEWMDDSSKVIVGDAAGSINRIKAESIRLCCELLVGNICYFYEVLPKLGWDKPAIYLLRDLIPIWVDAFADEKDVREKAPLEEALELGWANQKLRELLLEEFQKKENPALLHHVARLSDRHWYVCYAKVLVLAEDISACKDKAANEKMSDEGISTERENKLRQLVCDYFTECRNVFLVPEKLHLIISQYGWDWKVCHEQVSFLKWSADLAEFYKERGSKNGVDLIDDIYMEEEGIEGLLKYYIKSGIAYVDHLYRREAVEETPELLPPECRAAIRMSPILSMAEEDLKGRISCVREALREWSGLAPFARAYAAQLQERHQREEEKSFEAGGQKDRPGADRIETDVERQQQLRQMAEQVMAQVQVLLNSGHKDEAEEVVRQLRQLLPEDMDV